MSDHLYNATTGQDLCTTGPNWPANERPLISKTSFPRLRYVAGGSVITFTVMLLCPHCLSRTVIADCQNRFKFHLFQNWFANEWPLNKCNKKSFPRLRYIMPSVAQWSDLLLCFHAALLSRTVITSKHKTFTQCWFNFSADFWVNVSCLLGSDGHSIKFSSFAPFLLILKINLQNI